MKRLIIILFLMIFCFGFGQSPHLKVLARQNATESLNWTNITFYWRFETQNLDNPGDDYSAGDDTGTVESGASIGVSANFKSGTNGLDCPTGNDAMQFAAASIITSAEGRVGFWLKPIARQTGAFCFGLFDSSENRFDLRYTGSGELKFAWRDANTARTDLDSSGASVDNADEPFIEIAWQSSSNYREIWVDGVSVASTTASTINTFADETGMVFETGDFNAIPSTDQHFDQCILISSDKDDVLYDFRDELVYGG